MSKSKENNVGMSLRQISEGQLLKYTNMVKGWQNRWFVLDPHTGMLEYFMTESEKKQQPRASLQLAGAIVVPSEENSYTFSVIAANENSFKLRATDAKERQYWINRLRIVAQAHTQVLAESNPPLFRDHSQLSNMSTTSTTTSPYNSSVPSQKMLSCNLTVLDAFSSVRDYLRRVECEHQRLVHDIESLPSSGSTTTCTDTNILLLKATSQATLLCLEQCLAILHYQQQQPNNKVQTIRFNSASSSPLLGYSNSKKGVASKQISSDFTRLRSESAVSVLSDKNLSEGATRWSDSNEELSTTPRLDDETDYVAVEEEENPPATLETGNEEYKGNTLKLLSQLKLGTELTRVNLPVFFCEPRSLLQVLADAFRQPQILLKVIKESNAEHRMSLVVQWYLGCIRACQLEMTSARKPLNPVQGETFKCIWNLKEDSNSDLIVCRFVAEQVSHNPPLSAFHFECPQKGISVRGNLSVKAKFMGMYVGVTLGGDLVLELPVENQTEKYEMTFPMLYLRSFLSEPWLEFGGKININCLESKIISGIVFQTKPFYGGKPHQVTVEVKVASGNTVARLTGDWMSGSMELSWVNGETQAIDLQTVGDWLQKKIRPISSQAEDESLKIWQSVRQSLVLGDFATAAEHKKKIEEIFREKERKRLEKGKVFRAVYFELIGDIWVRKLK